MNILRTILVGPYLLYMVLAMGLGRFFWPAVFIVLGLLATAGGLGYYVGKFL